MSNIKFPFAKMSAIVVVILLGVAAKAKTTVDSVYSKQQAMSGERLYREHCLICHDKKYFQPVLEVWSGQTVGSLLEMMSATMPESDPGSLREKEYIAILAYIFSLSKFPAGDQPLENRGGKLDEILIMSP